MLSWVNLRYLLLSGRTKRGIHKRGIHEKVRFPHFEGNLCNHFSEIFVEIALIMDTPFVEPFWSLLILSWDTKGFRSFTHGVSKRPLKHSPIISVLQQLGHGPPPP